MAESFTLALSDQDFKDYLSSGCWDPKADDNIGGKREAIPKEVVERLVRAYVKAPASAAANQGLGLLALLLGIAEWGVKGKDLPPDPAGKEWVSDTSADSGKHLMSYAVGGVGISHADVGDLEEYVRWVAANDQIVPADHKPALLHLADITYGKEGILYDELRAAGHCDPPIANDDLLGKPFEHFQGPAGSKYCRDYENEALTAEDWRVFRTWMRASLRTEEAQKYLLGLWFRDYWRPTVAQVLDGEGSAEEMLVNVRVRNSAPAVARAACLRTSPLPGVAGRVQRQIDAYAAWKLKTARRRWKIMMRPVVLYRHFSDKPPLEGISCR